MSCLFRALDPKGVYARSVTNMEFLLEPPKEGKVKKCLHFFTSRVTAFSISLFIFVISPFFYLFYWGKTAVNASLFLCKKASKEDLKDSGLKTLSHLAHTFLFPFIALISLIAPQMLWNKIRESAFIPEPEKPDTKPLIIDLKPILDQHATQELVSPQNMTAFVRTEKGKKFFSAVLDTLYGHLVTQKPISFTCVDDDFGHVEAIVYLLEALKRNGYITNPLTVERINKRVTWLLTPTSKCTVSYSLTPKELFGGDRHLSPPSKSHPGSRFITPHEEASYQDALAEITGGMRKDSPNITVSGSPLIKIYERIVGSLLTHGYISTATKREKGKVATWTISLTDVKPLPDVLSLGDIGFIIEKEAPRRE